MNSLTLEQKITKQYVTIMRDKRFIAISGVFMIGQRHIVDDLPTAATNGRDVFYGRSFMEGITDPALHRFVILHEEYHKMLMHMSMYERLFKEDPQTANIAADLVINIMLDKQAGSKADGFIKVWEHAALDYAYDNMDTAAVYRKLRLKQQQGKQGKQGGQGKQSNAGNGQPGTPSVRAAGGGQAQDFDKHEEGVNGSSPLSPEEVKEIQQQIDTALRQGAQMAGKMGGSMDRSLTDLLEVQVNWEEQLQDFVRTHAAGNDLSTWRRPSRRWMSRDIYMPSHYTEAAKRILITIDTSGSISERQLRRALTEIKGACDTVHPEFVDVIYWDSEVAGHEVYEGEAVSSITDVTKPKGGGGTRVGCVLKYMRAKDIKPDCIIHFTDGYCESEFDLLVWPAPVLWCISTKGIVARSGKTLYVPVE